MNDDAASIDIEQLIPHRLPMRLVETVVEIDNESIKTTAVVQDTWPTARDGHAQTLMLIELIAQTAAVLQGWRERHEGDLLFLPQGVDAVRQRRMQAPRHRGRPLGRGSPRRRGERRPRSLETQLARTRCAALIEILRRDVKTVARGRKKCG